MVVLYPNSDQAIFSKPTAVKAPALSITTLSITTLFIMSERYYAECRYIECRGAMHPYLEYHHKVILRSLLMCPPIMRHFRLHILSSLNSPILI